MNFGQRQGKVSVAVAAKLRQVTPQKGTRVDKLSRPYGQPRGKWDGQYAFWGAVGVKSEALDEEEHLHVMGSTWFF